MYRARAVADAVAAGRFPIQGRELDLGAEPDWIGAALPADREWRLEWSKFYYGLDLAAAFAETHDPRYVDAWKRLVLSWIRQVPLDFDPTDVVGRRVQNWIYAWSAFADADAAPLATEGFVDRVHASLRDQIAYVRANLTRERNHRTLELYALAIGALALPELDPHGDLLDFAVAQLHANLIADVLPDGVQRERSTHYHHVVLRSFLGLRENLRRFGLALPDGFDQRLAAACEFSLHCHRPDGGIPALSDSDTGDYRDLLALAGRLLQRPDWTYAASGGREGAPPQRTNVSFPLGGYFVQRSGWGSRRQLADERFLMFDCGPLGDGGHGHYDALNVEIAAGGRPIVVDPGRYTYCDDAPHWRRWFKGTAAHNTVTVDGLDQTAYRRGRPKGPVASATLLQRLAGYGIDVMWGEAVSPVYSAVHRRRVIFVAGEYWILEDVVDDVEPHSYDLRFHLTPDAGDRVVMRSAPNASIAVAPAVALVFAGDAHVHVEGGWVAPSYAVKHAAPVVVARAGGVARARFITLVWPADAGDVPSLAVDDSSAGTTAVEISGVRSIGRWRDRIVWARSGCAIDLPELNCRAAAAWTREDEGSAAGAIAAAHPVDVFADIGSGDAASCEQVSS